jgi:hypothetical protein
VTATNAAGCTATASGTVTVNALPTPTVKDAHDVRRSYGYVDCIWWYFICLEYRSYQHIDHNYHSWHIYCDRYKFKRMYSYCFRYSDRECIADTYSE